MLFSRYNEILIENLNFFSTPRVFGHCRGWPHNFASISLVQGNCVGRLASNMYCLIMVQPFWYNLVACDRSQTDSRPQQIPHCVAW